MAKLLRLLQLHFLINASFNKYVQYYIFGLFEPFSSLRLAKKLRLLQPIAHFKPSLNYSPVQIFVSEGVGRQAIEGFKSDYFLGFIKSRGINLALIVETI